MNSDRKWVMVGGGAYEELCGARHFKPSPPPASWWDKPSPFAASEWSDMILRIKVAQLAGLCPVCKAPSRDGMATCNHRFDVSGGYPVVRTAGDDERSPCPACHDTGWEGDHRCFCDAGEA